MFCTAKLQKYLIFKDIFSKNIGNDEKMLYLCSVNKNNKVKLSSEELNKNDKNRIIMSNKNTRGSEWRKWDLHVHTASSHLNNNFGEITNDDFINQIVNSNISAIGLTNYFNFSENDYILKEELEKKDIVVFLNLELRLTYQNKEDQCCDIHVVFDNTIDKNIIQTFLGNLTAKVSGNEKKAVALCNDDFTNATIEFEHLKKKLEEPSLNLQGKYLLGFLSRGHGNGRTSTQYEQLANKCHLLIHSSDSQQNIDDDRTFWLQHNKPLLQSSDAHSIDQIGSKYTWIKADLTFNGLKQILFEPEERIRIQQNKPDDKKGYQVIDSVTLREKEFWNNTIYLNENLNTIIGGRSTGKSTLLKSIAKKIDDKIDLDEKEEDFIKNHIGGVSIKWKDDLGGETSRYIQFLPQNYMHAIAKNENRELDELIEKIISNKDENKILRKYNNDNKEIEKTLSKNILEAFQLQKELKELQSQLKEKGDKKGVEGEINRLNQKIKVLSENTEITTNEIEEYQKYLKEIGDIQHSIESDNNDIQLLNSLKERSLFSDDFVYHFDNLSENLKNSVTNSYEQLKTQVSQQWNGQLEVFIREIKDKIAKNSTSKTELENSEIVKKGKAHYDNNKELADIQSKLKEENERLQKIIEIEKKVTTATERKGKMIDTIVSEHLKYQLKANELQAQLKISHDNVKISTKIKCQSDDMLEFLKQRFNLRGSERQDYVWCVKDNYVGKTKEVVKAFVEDALQDNIDFKNWNTAQNVLAEFLTRNWYEYSFELTYQKDYFNEMSPGKKAFVILKLLLEFDTRECPILIDQPEDSLDNRAIYNELVQYIKDKKQTRQIILVTHNPNVVVSADSENVIVANQHGSKNLNDNGIRFQYVNGSLENSKMRDDKYKEEKDSILPSQGIREHVCELLEGGQEAFEKREKKYGFTN